MKKSQVRKIIRESVKKLTKKTQITEQGGPCTPRSVHVYEFGGEADSTPYWIAPFQTNLYHWTHGGGMTTNKSQQWKNYYDSQVSGICPSWMPGCWIPVNMLQPFPFGSSPQWSVHCIKYIGQTSVTPSQHPTNGGCAYPPIATPSSIQELSCQFGDCSSEISGAPDDFLFSNFGILLHPGAGYATYQDCIGGPNSAQIPGCNDPNAINGGQLAGTGVPQVGCPDANGAPDPNDTSCCDYTGCSDPSACNYFCLSNPQYCSAGTIAVNFIDDGSCILPDGCTDSTATNYDSNALCDDGGCVGCTDSNANNFCLTCPVDDGSCVYVSGCIDQIANNFDPNAFGDCSGVLAGNDVSCCSYDPTWDCVQIGIHPKFGSECTERFDGTGQFTSLSDCQTSGCEPLPSDIDRDRGVECDICCTQGEEPIENPQYNPMIAGSEQCICPSPSVEMPCPELPLDPIDMEDPNAPPTCPECRNIEITPICETNLDGYTDAQGTSLQYSNATVDNNIPTVGQIISTPWGASGNNIPQVNRRYYKWRINNVTPNSNPDHVHGVRNFNTTECTLRPELPSLQEKFQKLANIKKKKN